MEQRQERQEKKEKTEKKESAEKTDEPSAASTSKWTKQVTKLIRTNLDVLAFFLCLLQNYKQKDALKKAVINLIKEKNETADESEIAAVFEEKYPGLSRTVQNNMFVCLAMSRFPFLAL